MLDLRADHEAGHVLQEHERDVERVADLDEARGLVGGVVVEDAAEVLRLVGDDPRRAAADAREARDDRCAHRGLMSRNSPWSTIARMSLYMSYGLRLDSGSRSSSASSRRSIGSVTGRSGGALVAVRREEREVLLHPRDARRVARELAVADAADLGSGPSSRRAPARVMSSPTAALTSGGPPSAIEPTALDHRHEVGEARDVRGAGRAGADHRRDLRDDAAHDDLLAEQVPGAGEERTCPGGSSWVDARAGRVDEPHERAAACAAPSRAGA